MKTRKKNKDTNEFIEQINLAKEDVEKIKLPYENVDKIKSFKEDV